MNTGAPTTSAMKMVRRDQSISPIERSKTRRLEARKPGAGGSGRAAVGWVMTAAHRHFTRYWNTAWRLSSGDVTSSMAPNSPLAARSVSRA